MGFQKKKFGWGLGGWALSKIFLDFWNFVNFAKPLDELVVTSLYRFIAADGRDRDTKDRAWICPDSGRQTQGTGTVDGPSVILCHDSVSTIYGCMCVEIKRLVSS